LFCGYWRTKVRVPEAHWASFSYYQIFIWIGFVLWEFVLVGALLSWTEVCLSWLYVFSDCEGGCLNWTDVYLGWWYECLTRTEVFSGWGEASLDWTDSCLNWKEVFSGFGFLVFLDMFWLCQKNTRSDGCIGYVELKNSSIEEFWLLDSGEFYFGYCFVLGGACIEDGE